MPTQRYSSIIQINNLNGQSGFKIDGEFLNENSGISVSAAGDMNGDHYADILIGSDYLYSYVIFGSPEVGITEGGLLSLSSLNGLNGFKIDGTGMGIAAGKSVSAAGDVNRDGYADILISGCAATQNFGASSCGYYGIYNSVVSPVNSIYVIFGGPTIGLEGVLSLSTLDGKNGFIISPEVGDPTAISSAGDVNADGYPDIIIGSPAYPSGIVMKGGALCNNNGCSYVIFGGQNIGRGGSLALSSLNGNNGFKIDGEVSTDPAAYSCSGQSVSTAGDVNGDGYTDFIIASTYNPSTSGGRIYVVFGSPGMGSGGLLSLSSLNGVNGFKINQSQSSGHTVDIVAGAGDLNGDNYDDLLISHGDPDGNYPSFLGYSCVVFGGSNVGNGGLLSLSSLNGNNGFNIVGSFSFAFPVVSPVGDINKDTYVDFIVVPQGSVTAATPGIGYVILGGNSIGAGGTLSLSSLNGANGFALASEDAEDQPITSTSELGDVNGDVRPDFIMGAPNYNNGFGRSYVLFDLPEQAPSFLVNQLTITPRETVILDAKSVRASDYYTPDSQLALTASNIRYGHFSLLEASSQSVSYFTQQQISSGVIQFVHDGSLSAPSYALTATDNFGLQTGPLAAKVTFIPPANGACYLGSKKIGKLTSDSIQCKLLLTVVSAVPSVLLPALTVALTSWVVNRSWKEPRYAIHTRVRDQLNLSIGLSQNEWVYISSLFKLIGRILQISRVGDERDYNVLVGKAVAEMKPKQQARYAAAISQAIRQHIVFPTLCGKVDKKRLTVW